MHHLGIKQKGEDRGFKGLKLKFPLEAYYDNCDVLLRLKSKASYFIDQLAHE